MKTLLARTLEPTATRKRTHPSDEILALFIEGALATEERAPVVAHVMSCSRCYALVRDTLRHIEATARIRPMLLYPGMDDACEGLRAFWKKPVTAENFITNHRDYTYNDVVACETAIGPVVAVSLEFLRSIQNAGQQMREVILVVMRGLMKMFTDTHVSTQKQPETRLEVQRFTAAGVTITYDIDDENCLLLHDVKMAG
mgnify:CR=1 FL=1